MKSLPMKERMACDTAECEYVAEETVAYMQKKGSIEGRSVELRCLKFIIN